MNEDKIRDLSVRIIVDDKPIGSGVLFIPKGKKAYVFTAAHVVCNDKLNDKQLEIECYFDGDDAKDKNIRFEDFVFHANANDFKIHNGYPQEDCYDVAGIEIEKRRWMNERVTFDLLKPLNDMSGKCWGYPLKNHNKSIDFAVFPFDFGVKKFAQHAKMMQFWLMSNHVYDATDLTDDFSGVSGSGLFCDAGNELSLLSGLWKGSSSSKAIGGLFFGSIYNSIFELCKQQNWTSPRKMKVEKDVEFVEADNGSSITQTKYIVSEFENSVEKEKIAIEDMPIDIKNSINAIIDSINNGELQYALGLCNKVKEDLSSIKTMTKGKALTYVYEAVCYLYLKDFDKVTEVLVDKDSYPNEQKSFAYLLLSNVEMFKGKFKEAKDLISIAIKADDDNLQAKVFEEFVSIVLSKDYNKESDIAALEKYLSIGDIDLKDKQQIYMCITNMLYYKYQDLLSVIEFQKKVRSIRGDILSVVTIATLYDELSRSNNNDIVYCSLAVEYYLQFLSNVDEIQQNMFYKTQGANFINCLVRIERNDLILEFIDKVIENTTVYESLTDLRVVRANAAMLSGVFDDRYFENLPDGIYDSLTLHKRFNKLIQHKMDIDDMDYRITYDKRYPGLVNLNDGIAFQMEVYRFKKIETELIKDLVNIIDSNRLDDKTLRPMLHDLLDVLLAAKDVENYTKYLYKALSKYPGDMEFLSFKTRLNEINGNFQQAYDGVKQELASGMTMQNVKEAMSFFVRNRMYEDLRKLYKDVIESDLGQFEREQLIFRYIEFLAIPLSSRELAAREFLYYEKELSGVNRTTLMNLLGIDQISASSAIDDNGIL